MYKLCIRKGKKANNKKKMGKTRNRKKKGEKKMSRKKKLGKAKYIKIKKEKPKDKKKKTKEKKGKKTKAWKKGKKGTSKERHGPAYYFVCFKAMKKFVSKMKKASNSIRQAKRIESFRQIIKNKLAKV